MTDEEREDREAQRVANAGEWITHDGGPNPVSGQLVDVRYGAEWGGLGPSDDVDWLEATAYRLATPSPAAQDEEPRYFAAFMADKGVVHATVAQDDPAKGLEVVAWMLTKGGKSIGGVWPYSDRAGAEAFIEPDRHGDDAFALTDHAIASRQIAELRDQLAGAQEAAKTQREWRLAAEARASTLEAENKGLRELARHLIDWITDEVGAELPFSESDAKLIETAATLAKDTPQ